MDGENRLISTGCNVKLVEIIQMLSQFGFNEVYVRRALAGGDSAHNAFEGVKSALQIRWGEMCQEISAEAQRGLRPVYDRLMNITMRSRRTSADDHAEAKSCVDDIFTTMEREQAKRKGQNLREVFDLAAEYRRRQEEADKRKAAKKAAKKQKFVEATARVIDEDDG